MDREKQINEITKVIARHSMAFRNPNVAFMTTARKTADSIYNADYRKQSEGEWKQAYNSSPLYFCTHCNHLYNNKSFKYCPNCGAKMEGDKE